jgi:serine/threonine protein kinase
MESSINEKHINYRYNVIEYKGEGASCLVYLVEKRDTKKQYAGKVLLKQIPEFHNEIAILDKPSKLKNPNIVN